MSLVCHADLIYQGWLRRWPLSRYVCLQNLADFTTRQVHSLEDFATQRHMDLQTLPHVGSRLIGVKPRSLFVCVKKNRLNSIVRAMAFEPLRSAQQVMSAQLRADTHQRQAVATAGVDQPRLPNGIAQPHEARAAGHQPQGVDGQQSGPEAHRSGEYSVPENARAHQSAQEMARPGVQSPLAMARPGVQSLLEMASPGVQSALETARAQQSALEMARPGVQSALEMARPGVQSGLETARAQPSVHEVMGPSGQSMPEMMRPVGQAFQGDG